MSEPIGADSNAEDNDNPPAILVNLSVREFHLSPNPLPWPKKVKVDSSFELAVPLP